MAQKELLIGKKTSNHLVISDAKVSGVHCKVSLHSPTQLLVEDMDSTNGTTKNGSKIHKALFEKSDKLALAGFLLDLAILFDLLEQPTLKIGITPENYLQEKHQQEGEQAELKKLQQEFKKLEGIYEKYVKDKKAIMTKGVVKQTGIRAALSLIPFVGGAIGTLATGLSENRQIELLDLSEQFKKDYVCPACSRYLGEIPFQNLVKQKKCVCKAQWT